MALLKRKRAGLGDAMSVVTRFVNACNRHDADGVASCLHPDFDSIQPMYPTRNFRGADQVRRNWQAIFDAEPGFRLTVLRSAAMDDTVWLELHGAGREAEVAGVFVMGIQGDRIRWARIYSALVEPVPAGVGEEAVPVPLHEVPRHEGETVGEEAEPVIAPVVDIDRPGRRRGRRRSSVDAAVDAATADVLSTPEPDPVLPVEPDIEAAPVPEPAEAVDGPEPAEAVDGPEPAEAVDGPEPAEAVEVVEMVEVEPEVVVVVEDEVDVVPAAEAVVADADAIVVVEPPDDTPAEDDGGPPTDAVEMSSFTDADPEPASDLDTLLPPEPSPEPPPEPPKRRFGKRLRP